MYSFLRAKEKEGEREREQKKEGHTSIAGNFRSERRKERQKGCEYRWVRPKSYEFTAGHKSTDSSTPHLSPLEIGKMLPSANLFPRTGLSGGWRLSARIRATICGKDSRGFLAEGSCVRNAGGEFLDFSRIREEDGPHSHRNERSWNAIKGETS